MKKVNAKVTILDYYGRTYRSWYQWFSHLYDPFLRALFFILNGGFGGENRWRRTIIEWVDPRPGENVIDICCGTGTLTIMLAGRMAAGGAVIGLELSAALLKVARKKNRPGGIYFFQGDARAIPFRDGCFHKGVICSALHEVPAEVRGRILREAHRVIRPGGSLVVVEHNDPPRRWKRALFGLLERFNPEYPAYQDLLKCWLTGEIERNGFRVVRKGVTSWEFFQMVLAERIPEYR